MRKDLIQIVCCPVDKARLELEGATTDDHGDVVSGTLRCSECGFGYPIEEGIPNLLPPEYHVGVKSKPKAPKAGKDTAEEAPREATVQDKPGKGTAQAKTGPDAADEAPQASGAKPKQ